MNGSDAIDYNLTQHSPNAVVNVAILGAESTGKTTLCADLAAYFGSQWVPEYMRTYLQIKWDKEHLTCTWDDLLPIAQGQIELENTLIKQTAQLPNKNRYLFCDTSLFELMVYANWYYGDCPKALTKAALAHHYDMVLLTETDVPWVADDLRDSPHERKEISAYFEEKLIQHNQSFRRIGGDREERVQQVAAWLSEINH